MRYAIPILLLLAAAWYYTTGIRVGMVTFTPTTMINANGKSNYKLRSFEERKQVGLTGSCTVKSGLATIRLFNPAGQQVDGKQCQPGGPWSLVVRDQGDPGVYKAVVEYRNFNGKIELNELLPGK